MKLAYLSVFLVGCGQLVDQGRAVHALEAAGYRHVQVLNHYSYELHKHGCAASAATAFAVFVTTPDGSAEFATICCTLVPDKSTSVRGCTLTSHKELLHARSR